MVSCSKSPLGSKWCRWCQWCLRLIKLSRYPLKTWRLNNSATWDSSKCNNKSTSTNFRCTWCSSNFKQRVWEFHKWCHSFSPSLRSHNNNNSLTPVTSEHRPADKQVIQVVWIHPSIRSEEERSFWKTFFLLTTRTHDVKKHERGCVIDGCQLELQMKLPNLEHLVR